MTPVNDKTLPLSPVSFSHAQIYLLIAKSQILVGYLLDMVIKKHSALDTS